MLSGQSPAGRGVRTTTLLIAGVLFAVGATLYGCAPALFAPSTHTINVRWQSGLDENTRDTLEELLSLRRGRYTAGSTWSYLLTDVSRAGIERVVQHPAVLDTHGVDRAAYTPLPRPVGPAIARGAAGAIFFVGIISLLGSVGRAEAAPQVVRKVSDAVHTAVRRSRFAPLVLAVTWGWVSRGVPSAGPTAVAAFRIIFGVLTLLIVLRDPVSSADVADPLTLLQAQGPYGLVVRWLGAHPSIVDWLTPWLIVTGLLFIAGAWTVVSYPAFVFGYLLWGSVWTIGHGTHAISALLLTLLCLLPSRWADAWSIDSLIRPHAGRTAGAHYGFTLWIPRLVISVALAAAAYAKMAHGWDWIANGTVKYHFMTDYPRAVVDWGLELANLPALAVTLSFMTVLIEALVVTAAFSRMVLHRFGMAVATVGLFTGFWLFQGVFWPGWWALFVSFLPFALLGDSTKGTRRIETVAGAQFAVIVLLVLQQFVVSSISIDARPLLSRYDMYSGTYESFAEYERSLDPSRDPSSRLTAARASGSVDLSACRPNDELVAVLRAAADGNRDGQNHLRSILEECAAGNGASVVQLEANRPVWDPEQQLFVWRDSVVLVGPVELTETPD